MILQNRINFTFIPSNIQTNDGPMQFILPSTHGGILYRRICLNSYESFRTVISYLMLYWIFCLLLFPYLVYKCSLSSPGINVYTPVTAILPLVFILFVGALKDGYEDYLRHKTDNKTNQKPVTRYRNYTKEVIQTQNLVPGDFVLLKEFNLYIVIVFFLIVFFYLM